LVSCITWASIETCCGLGILWIKSQWAVRFSAPIHTGPVAHPASYTVGTASFQGVKWSGHGFDHPPHLAPTLKKE